MKRGEERKKRDITPEEANHGRGNPEARENRDAGGRRTMKREVTEEKGA